MTTHIIVKEMSCNNPICSSADRFAVPHQWWALSCSKCCRSNPIICTYCKTQLGYSKRKEHTEFIEFVCEQCTVKWKDGSKKEEKKESSSSLLIQCTRCRKELNHSTSKVNFKTVCEECTEKFTQEANLALAEHNAISYMTVIYLNRDFLPSENDDEICSLLASIPNTGEKCLAYLRETRPEWYKNLNGGEEMCQACIKTFWMRDPGESLIETERRRKEPCEHKICGSSNKDTCITNLAH